MKNTTKAKDTRNMTDRGKHTHVKDSYIILAASFFAVLAIYAFVCLGTMTQNTSSDSRLFWTLTFQCGTLGAAAALFGFAYSHRLMPNLAIAIAWVILCVVWFDIQEAPQDRITLVDVFLDAYKRGRKNGLLETLLKFYGIGFFGTVLVSLGPEIAKGIWSDEVRSTDNKTLLSKFKRNRRQILLRTVGSRISISGIYLRLLAFGVVFALVLVSVFVKEQKYPLIFEADLLLLLFAASMEAIGIFTHSIITDGVLISAERYYLRCRRQKLSGWLAEDGWRSSDRVSNYFTVLIHTYCNHGLAQASHSDLFPGSIPLKKQKSGNADMAEKAAMEDTRNMDIALRLIEQFDYTKKQYIEPIEEQYWVNARQSFEPAFALDLDGYLFRNRTFEGFPVSELHAIAIARDCFFTKQKRQWQDWLYTSGMFYESTVAELMLTYLRMRFLNAQNPPRIPSEATPCAEEQAEEQKLNFASILLEFPYIMEACVRERNGYSDRRAGEDEAETRSRDYFHLTADGHPPKYRERVEQYYAMLYHRKINTLDAATCNKIAARFAHFLTYIYEDESRTEQYLHRILPINSNNFRATFDVSMASIMFTPSLLTTLAANKNRYVNPVSAWQTIVRENVNLVEPLLKHHDAQLPRLCLYSSINRPCMHRAEKHDVGRNAGCCCVSREEQCEVLASILYESNK